MTNTKNSGIAALKLNNSFGAKLFEALKAAPEMRVTNHIGIGAVCNDCGQVLNSVELGINTNKRYTGLCEKCNKD